MVVLLCLFNFIPIVSYGEEARDQDKEIVDETVDTDEESDTSSEINLAEQAKSAIMIEASTGKIIYEKNANESMPMASMTKMMTLLLIMENIDSGNLTWDEKITTSDYAASMGGSQIFLQPFTNWGTYFNRLQNPAVQMPRIKKNCPTLYKVMTGEDPDNVREMNFGGKGDEMHGLGINLKSDVKLPIMLELNKDIMLSLRALANKVATICNELYTNPPFPAWRDGLDEIWN